MGDCNTIIRGKKVNGGFSVFNVMLVDYLEWISGMFGVVITTVWELIINVMLGVVITTVYELIVSSMLGVGNTIVME